MYKIFIVEDDSTIAGAVASHLSKWDLQTQIASDFKDVIGEFIQYDPHLVLLDISLPFFNGYYWCTEIRKLSEVPVIFISSAGDKMDIVMAMNMGADDFIPKPFDLTVLAAKVQAMLRRAYSMGGQLNVIERGGLILNLNDSSYTVGKERTELTKNEFRILRVLMENAGSVVPRDTIMLRLWESDSFIDDNTLTVNMTRLRHKLSQNGLPDFILTKKGVGYMVE